MRSRRLGPSCPLRRAMASRRALSGFGGVVVSSPVTSPAVGFVSTGGTGFVIQQDSVLTVSCLHPSGEGSGSSRLNHLRVILS